MFNSTHTLVGLAIARTAPEKWGPNAAATAVIASNLPDIDSIAGLWGTAAYLDHHRGITHSLIGVPLLALLLSSVMYFFSGKFGKTYAIAVIAMATHPALDYLNSYGLRPFLPWSGTWYYGDAVFIIDPYLDLLLLIGILAGSWIADMKRMAARLTLVAALVYIGARIELHAMAQTKLDTLTTHFPSVVGDSAVLPEMWNPLMWEGIVESKQQISRLSVHALTPSGFPPPTSGLPPDFNPMDRGPSSQLVLKAAAARSAATLLRFARFPVTRVQPLLSGYRITFMDFRFYREGTNTALASEVTLDESLRVKKESLSFVERLN